MTSNLAQTEIADHAAMLREKADVVHREKLAANDDSALRVCARSTLIGRLQTR